MTKPPKQVDPLTRALDTINLPELTGDPRIDGAEAASLIRKGIRVRNLWATEYEIRGEVIASAVALCEVKGWEYDSDDPMMLQNLAERLATSKDEWVRHITWCLGVVRHDYYREWPLDELELGLMRTSASNLLDLFHRHMPPGVND